MALAASCEQDGELWTSQRALHPGVHGGPEKVSPTVMSQGGVSLLQWHLRDWIVSQRTQAARSSWGNTFMNELLATTLLNHVQHEAVARGSFQSFWI